MFGGSGNAQHLAVPGAAGFRKRDSFLTSQVTGSQGFRVADEWCTRRRADHLAALFSRSRAHFNDMVGSLNHQRVVLDDNDGVPFSRQVAEDAGQGVCVSRMQSDGRFVQYV